MAQDDFFVDNNKPNLFKQVMKSYFPYWPVFLILILLSLSVTWLYLRSQPRIYVAVASVLIKDPNKGVDSKVLESLNIFSEKKIVDNEILVLRSSSLLSTVVKDLGLYATVYNEGKVQTEELYGSNAPLYFIALQKDSVRGGGNYPFSIAWKERFVRINGKEIHFNETITLNGTQYKIIPNEDYNTLAEGKSFFVVTSGVPEATGALISNLKINPISLQSTVLDARLETRAPQKGVDVLNKLFEVYNDAGIIDKNEMAKKTISFIEDRLNVVTAQLDSAEDNVQDFRSRNKLVDISNQAAQYSSTMADLETRQAQVQIQMDVLNNVQNYVDRKQGATGTVPALSMVSDPLLPGLVNDLYTAEIEVGKVSSIAGEKSEQVILANRKVAMLKKSIKENLNNIKNSYNIERQNINGKIGLNSGKLSQVPMQERKLMELSRQQTIKNNVYTYLLQKREETALSSASTSADMRVLESARSFGPIRPVPKNFYLIGFLIGLLAFVAYVLLKEQLNNKVLFRKQIEDKVKIPVIGEIVYSKAKSAVVIKEGSNTVVAEQFRALRTNLGFLGMNENNNVLLVSSSIGGEGKSFIAINLAMSLTLSGKRVALLEMDLRKPKLNKYLEVPREPGITNYLAGQNVLQDIIKPTAFENLYLLTAGPIPPNPSELVEREAFAVMMAHVRENFDYVVIDSAPVGAVTDGLLLKSFVDTTLYIVRHNVTPQAFLNLAQSLHEEEKFKNMAIVFNGIKPRGFSLFNLSAGGYGNGYGHGYGYGYGFGYGYGGSEGYFESGAAQPGFKNLWGIFKKKRS